MYDGYAYSSSGTSLTIKDVQIGAQTINQDLINTIDKDITLSANSKAYICDKLSPMFGVKKDQKRGDVPGVAMQHLASIAAIKIVNKGDGGDIVVSSIEITAPEAIVGEFEIVITDNDNVSFTATNASSTARVELASPTSIKKDEHIIIYVPIKPFEASNKDITIAVNGNTDKEKGYGSYRTVKMQANTNLQAGKITTFNVPVKPLKFGKTTTNIFDYKSKIFKNAFVAYEKEVQMVQLNESTCSTMDRYINGKKISTITIGKDNANKGEVTIYGKATDLIKRIPIEFYASSYDGSKSIMRLENIKVVLNVLFYVEVALDYTKLTNYMSGERITFNRLLPMEIYNDKSAILDEEPYHKRIDSTAVVTLLNRFDDDDTDGKVPTFKGLYDAIVSPAKINTANSSANITATIIYDKIMPIAKEVLGSTLSNVFEKLFSTPYSLFNYISSSISVEITLSTLKPSDDNAASDARVIVWGLNSNGPAY